MTDVQPVGGSATPDNPRGQAGRPTHVERPEDYEPALEPGEVPPPRRPVSDVVTPPVVAPSVSPAAAKSLISEDELAQYAQPVMPAVRENKVAPTPDKPGFMETAEAAFAQSNILGATLEKQAFGGFKDFPAKPGYDPFVSNGAELHGYEEYAEKFARSQSPEETQNIKNRIDAERADRDVLARTGASGYVASLATGALDPLMLTTMFIPGLEGVGIGRLAKVTAGIATNVAAGEAQQAAIVAQKQTEDYSDGILPRIAANALLAGVLGGIATRVPRKELDDVAGATRDILNAPPESSTAGAAAVRATTLADESIARGGEWIGKTVGQVSPTGRIFTNSEVAESRRLAQQLVDPGFMLEKNMRGEATLPSVEITVNQRENMRNFQLIRTRDAAYAEYKAEGGTLSGREFDAEIADAMRNGDTHDIKQVADVAKFARPMFEQDRATLAKQGRLPEDGGVLGAPSYFPRVYDQRAIMANRTDIEARLYDWYKNHPLGENNAKEFIEDFYNEHGEALKESEVQLDLARGEGEKEVHLQNFIAPSRGKGAGRPFMTKLRQAADEAGITITTRASPIKETAEQVITDADRAKLQAYYESHGFEATGNAPGEMIRHPVEGKGREPLEIKDRVYETLDRIQGTVRGTADIGHDVKNPNVLKARKLDVPDEILKPYLSHDFEHVMRAYNRTILPNIEMHEAFGSIDLKDQFQDVVDAYRVKIEAATSNEDKARLVKQQGKDLEDLALLRDRVLNQTGPRGNESLNMVRAAQLARSFNYLRTLGGQTLSALSDVGRLVTRYGLFNTSKRLVGLLSGFDQGIAKADAQRMATALDNVLHTRMHTLEGIGDDTAGSATSRVMGNLTANFTKITGIAAWDSMMRTLSSQLEQDALHRLIIKDNMSAFERAKLASHGIGDAELPAVKAQWLKHASDESGLHRARTELWEDRNAAQLVENAVQRAGSSNAFFVGKGDLPAFANTQMGKMILQFKGFAVSSVNRLAIPLAQGLAHGDVMAANGLASMLALGALTYYTKELAAGRKPDLSPDRLIVEAIQRSGILTYMPDIYDPIAGSLHLPRFSKFQDHNPLETSMGATFGAAATMLDTIQRMSRGNLSAADIHKLRQLIPWNNVFYLTRLVNMVEGKIEDAVGARNAPGKPAADYLNPMKDEDQKDHPDKQHFLGIDAIPNAF